MCKNSESIKIRIETILYLLLLLFYIYSKNSESIKIRIETNFEFFCSTQIHFVRIVNPLKQGLRLKSFYVAFSICYGDVRIVNPLKQGLRLKCIEQ